jgi:hypothetical protein
MICMQAPEASSCPRFYAFHLSGMRQWTVIDIFSLQPLGVSGRRNESDSEDSGFSSDMIPSSVAFTDRLVSVALRCVVTMVRVNSIIGWKIRPKGWQQVATIVGTPRVGGYDA